MISNELLEEVINISSKGQFVSRGLLLRIGIDVIEKLNYETKSKFQEIKFVNLDWDFALATCSRRKGIIELDYNKLVKQEKEEKIFSYLKANLSIIQYLLHEIEHLNEHYKITKNDIESKIINISSGSFVMDVMYNYAKTKYNHKKRISSIADKFYSNFQEDNWEIIPLEKIAEADSYKNLINSLNNYPDFSNRYPKLYEYMLDEYLEALKLGYYYNSDKKNYNIPLIEYLCSLNKYNCKLKLEDVGLRLKTKIDISNTISLEEKLKCGLMVSNEDINNIKEKILIKGTK